MKLSITAIAILTVSLITGCKKADDMAFDRVASPVLVVTTPAIKGAATNIISASFYSLDKSGILDSNTGIDSIPVAGLLVEIYTGVNTKIADAVTGADGSITLELDKELFGSATSFSWAGVHNNIAFRKSQSL